MSVEVVTRVWCNTCFVSAPGVAHDEAQPDTAIDLAREAGWYVERSARRSWDLCPSCRPDEQPPS